MNPYFRVYSNESASAEHALTLKDAQARAEELAAQHPGRCFEILRCVGYASTSKVSTFWMDGGKPEPEYRYFKATYGCWRVSKDGDVKIANGGEWNDSISALSDLMADSGIAEISASELPPHIKP